MIEIPVSNKILHELDLKEDGTIIFPSDFNHLGTADAVKMALSRYAKAGLIKRLAHGIYLKPKKDPEIGTLTPSLDEIAKAIARRDNARIIPTGIMAMHLLGLTTQIPMKAVYLTDGSPRIIHIGNRTIKFKSTSTKNLSLEGSLSKLLILALKELGEERLNQDILKIINEIIKKENQKVLENDIRKAPNWISALLQKKVKENKTQPWNL